MNTELAALRKEKEDRERDELTAKGEHEKVAEQEKAKRLEAEAKALGIARRAAFIGAAAGKVSDAEAAYKLAVADGMLNDLDVDDDGNAKDDKAPAKLVDEIVKKYEFLKPTGSRSFGRENGGRDGGEPNLGPNATASDMLKAAYGSSPVTGRRQ